MISFIKERPGFIPGLIIIGLLLLYGGKASPATCIIVYSPGTNGDWMEKFTHELAHCNGWVHGMEKKFYPVPQEYIYPYKGTLINRGPFTTERAKELCNGHFGCQCFVGFNCTYDLEQLQ